MAFEKGGKVLKLSIKLVFCAHNKAVGEAQERGQQAGVLEESAGLLWDESSLLKREEPAKCNTGHLSSKENYGKAI